LESLANRYFNSPIKQNSVKTTLPVTVAYNRAREADAVVSPNFRGYGETEPSLA